MSNGAGRAAAAPPEKTGSRCVPILLLAALAVAMSQTIAVAALPVFSREEEVSATTATWLLTAFMLASAVVTPIAGRLGDLHGHRRVMVAGLLLLCAGSVLAAVSDLDGWFPGLLVGRALQGCSGGVFPVVFGLARGSLPPRRLHGVVAALSAMFGIGGALGMVVAGPLVDVAGTSWLFWISLVMAGACLAGVPLLPQHRWPRASAGGRERLDVGGASSLAATLIALLLAISQGRAWGWGSAATLGLFAAAVVLGALFVVAEARAATPIIDLGLFVRAPLIGTNVTTLVISIGMFAAVTLIPQFAQAAPAGGYGFGYTPAQTGAMLLPTAAMMVVAAPLAPRLARATSGRTVVQLGALLACVALVVFAVGGARPWEFYLGAAVLGIAYGLAFASLGGLVVRAVGPEQTGAATGTNTILRTIGGALGAQLAAVVLVGSSGTDGRPTEGGYVTAFLVSGAVALAALGAAAGIRQSSIAVPRLTASDDAVGEGAEA